jgi:hypothetical protein
MDALHIKYRRTGPSPPQEEYSTETLVTADHTVISTLVSGLRPFSLYKFFVVPSWRGHQGCPSNSFSIETPEGGTVLFRLLNTTRTVLVTYLYELLELHHI